MMTPDEFVETVAEMVAGLQVPVSLARRGTFGAAYPAWDRLITEANGGFGWTDKTRCEEAFRKILDENS